MIGDDRKFSKGDDASDRREADEQHAPTQEEIAQRAYERFLARSASAEDDWYAAERELREAGRRAQESEARHPEQVTISSPPPNAPRAPVESPTKKVAAARRPAAKATKKPGPKP